MKNKERYRGFEQGPIRPPSEAESLLIRVSRNCPWNKCTFCSLYKKDQFSRRPLEHILADIDSVRFYADAILEAKESGTRLSENHLLSLSPTGVQPDHNALHAAAQFVASGMQSVFIQDGNSLIIKPESMIQILSHLSQSFPTVKRITSYARSRTVAKISDEHLGEIRRNGLNRIHIGMESAADAVLQKVKKGVDKATHVLAGQKVKRAGIELSEYFMPGLGGRSLSHENALETADALNQINPDFIRLRTLALANGAPLTEEYLNGEFDKMGEVETAKEILLLLENLEGISSRVRSDHVLNLFPEIDGSLPDDKERLMQPLKDLLDLPPDEQMLFVIGKRTRRLYSVGDLKNPAVRKDIESVCSRLGARVDNYDGVIDTLMRRYI